MADLVHANAKIIDDGKNVQAEDMPIVEALKYCRDSHFTPTSIETVSFCY